MTPLRQSLLVLLAATTLGVRAETIPAPLDQPYPGTIALRVDATNTSQQIFRVTETIPAKPGKLTLLYPQWVPANHGPSGPLNQLAGLRFSANGKPLAWKRDTVNVHAFHLEVPSGAASVEAEYQYLSPTEANQGRTTITAEILGVQWHSMALYPAGYATRRIMVQPTLTLPEGWQYGSALETQERQGDVVRFKPLDLETLVDSPLFAGRHFKRYDLDPGAKLPVHLNVVADTAEAVEAKPEQIELHRALIQQTYKLFNSQHFAHYDFLLALSEEFGGIGREHHQSSENGVKLDYFTDWAKAESMRGLLPHEFAHSWNGKFRRPADQNVPDFNTPLQNSLLWVYEGQTQYWGHVLSSRSGLIKLEHVRDTLAATAARYDAMRGRSWRPVQDTTNDPIINGRRPLGWSSWQRSEDYYNEGALIWLDVDTKIRELSADGKSLDHFARNFFGIDNGAYTANHYVFEDVVKALNALQPHDWAAFLRARLDGNGPAPLDGLTRAGWKLVYTDTPTPYLRGVEERAKSADFQYSLGFSLNGEGKVEALQWEGPGFQAGLGGGTTVLAVNGTAYKPEVLRAAVTAAKTGGKDAGKPIELLVKKGGKFRTILLDYHGGLRYPRLERIPDTPDRLQAILSPL
ncbi:M61 family metallopeptidase [Pseudoduganella namucuonensis]|uniref:Predicted metalloprotease, contains C-terminal PDZ domain n=1 Tax=Pseudoduganella namucuonensis TaxID=1035707 RepID=A0A1I7M348_9BURK|nr:M61 family metallopeptidase [Pseudoduganella namucuonensis]SFV16358.1 Predicted metalloprotease, contains C-terminal PDZ domain [Pseudoduganella namucuonensis]